MSQTDLNSQRWLDYGRGVLNAEAQALTQASERLGSEFSQAVELILRHSGKVVVSGLGKSGHVARKVAATLASTGTASFFLHPAEALHGDLGMLRQGDVLLAIAFGGETEETLGVARFARRNSIPVISISGKPESNLSLLADVALNGSISQEACPLNLAPTTSTTLAMALGDALAVALMKARDFREHDFANFHPAGSLGRKLSLVGDYMRTDMLSLRSSEGFERILEVITAHNYGVAAVIDDDKRLVGAISDGDLRRALIKGHEGVFSLTAGELMSRSPKCIAPETLAIDAVRYMEKHKVSTLFVSSSEDKKLLGLLRMYDLLEAKVI